MTSIEWLWEQIPFEFTSKRSAFEIFEQAKEMHKQETETLHTEEQVKQAMFETYLECENGNNFFNVQDKIIQSLKQHKKD
jgi:hypothetical protein